MGSHATKLLWRRANSRLIPCAILALAGALTTIYRGPVGTGSTNHRLIAIAGVVVFAGFALACLHIFINTINKLSSRYLGPSRAGTIKFSLAIIGYLSILLATLGLLAIPVGRLLLGGAVTGIVLGVAAQQSLANFFASVILLLSQPFAVGDRILIKSGALGGDFLGVVEDIGLTHTQLLLDDGDVVLLPNSSVLSGSAILPFKKKHAPKPPEAQKEES